MQSLSDVHADDELGVAFTHVQFTQSPATPHVSSPGMHELLLLGIQVPVALPAALGQQNIFPVQLS